MSSKRKALSAAYGAFALFTAMACSRGGSSPSAAITAEPAAASAPAAVSAPAVVSAPAAARVPPPPPRDEMGRRVLDVAHSYFSFPRVDDTPHFAPDPCGPTAPWGDNEPEIRRSSAPFGELLHGRKLYYLYVSNERDYLHPKQGPDARSPVGQAIVKQAWTPREIAPGEKVWIGGVLEENGHRYTGDKLAGLFVMLKLDPRTPGTDRGWVYGLVTGDDEVKEAGAIERCMACHREAPHDRLFGPIKSGRAP